MASVYQKDPNAVLFYTFDWAPWLGVGETISSVVNTAPPGLTIASSSNTTTAVTIKLSGGTAGQSYKVANRITTSAGQTDERTMIIQVDER